MRRSVFLSSAGLTLLGLVGMPLAAGAKELSSNGVLLDRVAAVVNEGVVLQSELDLQLRRRGINTIVLAGIATNFGVESTARDAWFQNYSVVIAEDAASSLDAELHRFSIEKILPRLARVRSTAEIVARGVVNPSVAGTSRAVSSRFRSPRTYGPEVRSMIGIASVPSAATDRNES